MAFSVDNDLKKIIATLNQSTHFLSTRIKSMITKFIKDLFLIILAIWILGCVDFIPEKNEDTSPKELMKGQKPPRDLKLSSILYELATDPETEKFAEEHSIILANSKVRVFISFDPASSNPEREKIIEKCNILVEKKSDYLLRVLIPIDKLIPLSKDSVIWSIRLPDKAINLLR